MNDSAPLVTAPEVLTAILAALKPAVSFVILRNYEDLPKGWGNDVDILISPSDLALVRKITVDILRRSPHAPAARTMERLNFWSARLPCIDRELQIDFYTAISKAWANYADAKAILAARRPSNALFSVPDPLHELLLIAAKELFAYGRIRSRYHKKLAGHDKDESLKSAMLLFSGYLTLPGCRMVANALTNPTVAGRPGMTLTALLQPRAILKWARLRRNGFKPMFDENRRVMP